MGKSKVPRRNHSEEFRAFLEIDHIVPFSLGGSSLDPTNLRLCCRIHNQFKGGAKRSPSRELAILEPGRK